MFDSPIRGSPDWVDLVFAAKTARKGGVVRRSVRWVEREVGRADFIAYVRARGFQLYEVAGQFIVVCGQAPMRRLL